MRYFCLAYLKQTNGQYNESTAILKTLRTKDVQKFNVIMDFKDSKVLKCHVDGQVGNKDWNTVLTYYNKYYSTILQQLTDYNKK